LVSIDLFSLLCSGGVVTSSNLGDIERYGGVLLYLIIYGLVLFGILVWVDSGSILLRLRRAPARSDSTRKVIPDVVAEEKSVSKSNDSLRVLQVTKSFGGNVVVDDVSFGVSKETIFALLGPNGAGKTTIFNIIREHLLSLMAVTSQVR
jgi:ATP-binding cassette subfamily A (ABC1) protein 3